LEYSRRKVMAEVCQNEKRQHPRHHGEKLWFLDGAFFLAGYLRLMGMAERVGFEPTVTLRLHTLSRRA
jgi:hypothetical protein